MTVWITTDFGKFFNKSEYQTTWPTSWKICMQVKKQEFELDMEQQISSKEAQAGIKIAGWTINNLKYADDITLMAESKEELKSLLMKVKSERVKNLA